MAETSLDAFKAKDTRFVADWLKSKGLHKLCSVLEGIQEPNWYYLWHVRVLSIKPCLHTQLPAHNRSYWKVSRGWGRLITWNGPMLGHLNSFSDSGEGSLNKNFPKIQMPGGLPGGGCLSFDLTGTLWGAWHNAKIAFVEKSTLISWFLAILGVSVSGKVLL